ncbi:MAG: hypothetical protein QNL24_00325 [Akkermansiaceae bacterium]
MDSDALIGQAYFTILIPSKQVAAHLRGELLQGYWNGTMAGVPALAAELNMNLKRNRRTARWAINVARGKDDRCQTLTKAEFVDGGTVGEPH